MNGNSMFGVCFVLEDILYQSTNGEKNAFFFTSG